MPLDAGNSPRPLVLMISKSGRWYTTYMLTTEEENQLSPSEYKEYRLQTAKIPKSRFIKTSSGDFSFLEQ
jgi:hypothetical protein